jgi:general secretion pathway protein J
MMKKPHIDGFTLVELLIALFIFAILATLTTLSLTQSIKTKRLIDETSVALAPLEYTLLIIKQDTHHAINRAIRGNDMRLFPPFIGQKNYIEFTRNGIINPFHEKKSNLLRVAYLCENKKLIRRIFEAVDSTDRKHYSDTTLLNNLSKCAFEYISHRGETLSEWREFALSKGKTPEFLPAGMIIHFGTKKFGEVNLDYSLSSPQYE